MLLAMRDGSLDVGPAPQGPMEVITSLSAWTESGGDGGGARYQLRKAPELTQEMASRRWRELNLLLHSLAVLRADWGSKQPLLHVLRACGSLVGARRGLLYLREENGGGVRLMGGFGFNRGVPERLRAHSRMAEAALRGSKPMLVHDPVEEWLRDELAILGEPACLTAPVLKQGLPWGALLFARSEPFGEDEAVLLWLYCLVLEGSLSGLGENGRLRESTAGAGLAPALVDRRLFEARLDREIERCGWTGGSYSLLRVRWRAQGEAETAGETGLRSERALRAVRRSLRPDDLMVPWEEEDLLISLPDRDGSQAERVAQTLRRNLAQSGALITAGRPLSLLRVAVASVPLHGRSRQDLLRTLESRMA